MIVLGEDWCGCAATFPIHMGRAFGLQQPMVRRFDLINPDCSLLLLRAKPLEQNLAMAHGVRLFLFRTADGRYAAQYWEGMHGLWDPPHVVTVDFPPNSVRPVNVHGEPRGDGPGGQLRMSVGCGGHTPFRSDLVLAEPALPLAEFRRALLAGNVSDVPGCVIPTGFRRFWGAAT